MQDFDMVSGIAASVMPTSNGSKVLFMDGTRIYFPATLDTGLAGAKILFKGKWERSGHGRYFLARELESGQNTQNKKNPLTHNLEELFPPRILEMASSQRGLVKKLVSLDRKQLFSILKNPWLLYLRRYAQFTFCDLLADALYISRNTPQRFSAAVLSILNEAYKSGPYPVTEEAIKSKLTTLGTWPGDLTRLSGSITVRDENGNFHLPRIYKARQEVLGIVGNNQMGLFVPECKSPSVSALLSMQYSILTGKPGTGKTTLLKYIKELPLFTITTATTGKAAQLLEGETIHKVLGFGPKGFTVRSLECDLLIVDEASMLDWPTAQAIFRAAKSHVILSGDPEQLPPVGGESVFRVLLKNMPVVELTTQHRFAAGQAKIHKMLCRNANECLIVTRNIISALVKRNMTDYQVISPVKCGIGTFRINLDLQNYINPDGVFIEGTDFRVGDKVIVTKNCYDKSVTVANGELGRITGLKDNRILVSLQKSTVVESFRPSEIELAYCLTVHKAQGSQWDFVIFVSPDGSSNPFVSPELIHTATTRARNLTYAVAA